MARPKYHSGPQKIALGEVASATVIAAGDLLYQDTSTKQVKPFASLGDSGSKAQNQEAARNVFVGVSRKASQSGQTNPVPMARDGIFIFTATSAEYLVGDFVGPQGTGAGSAVGVSNTDLEKVDGPTMAIGRVAEYAAVGSTSIRVQVMPVVGAEGVNIARLPAAKFATGALQSATFAAGDLTGADNVNYINTGTTPANLTTRTATQMFNDTPGAFVGMSYVLNIRNGSGSANTATIVAGTGVTLTGTMTIAQNVTRQFVVTFTAATTLTIQSMGILAAGA